MHRFWSSWQKSSSIVCCEPEFSFDDVAAVVMDEFHSFNDPERGIVWEFSLGLLPPHVRLLLLSATVGNAREFVQWMNRTHQRRLELVHSDQRKVPLTFQWVGDLLLNEQLEQMAQGDESARFTPALVFCFNRDECWNVAEQLKGKGLLADGQQAQLAEELAQARLVARSRPQAETNPAARCGCASRRTAAVLQANCRAAVSTQAAFGDRLYRDAGGRDQPAGPQRRGPQPAQRTAGQQKADRRQQCPPDVWPRRPPSV